MASEKADGYRVDLKNASGQSLPTSIDAEDRNSSLFDSEQLLLMTSKVFVLVSEIGVRVGSVPALLRS